MVGNKTTKKYMEEKMMNVQMTKKQVNLNELCKGVFSQINTQTAVGTIIDDFLQTEKGLSFWNNPATTSAVGISSFPGGLPALTLLTGFTLLESLESELLKVRKPSYNGSKEQLQKELFLVAFISYLGWFDSFLAEEMDCDMDCDVDDDCESYIYVSNHERSSDIRDADKGMHITYSLIEQKIRKIKDEVLATGNIALLGEVNNLTISKLVAEGVCHSFDLVKKDLCYDNKKALENPLLNLISNGFLLAQGMNLSEEEYLDLLPKYIEKYLNCKNVPPFSEMEEGIE